jgi:predicted Na+-dependent transporter
VFVRKLLYYVENNSALHIFCRFSTMRQVFNFSKYYWLLYFVVLCILAIIVFVTAMLQACFFRLSSVRRRQSHNRAQLT